ncbi:major facilitator superfamily domain-containing protein [Annulohypoxylon nitens]|nr:major facilitator superfamily domain-containing protein [Annulohypoxylon nitens]
MLEEPSVENEATSASLVDQKSPVQPGNRPTQFWIIIASLSLLAFISALDAMIITTALPTITKDIGGSSEYVWIADSFLVASTVLQPLIGQFADTLGRKIPTIGSVALFTIGSGIAGGAHNVGMFIAGRSIQGIGAGGMYVLIDIICCDLVPLRERGKYLGIVNSTAAVAAAIGPVLGGALARANWRWIFWLNIPICGVPFFTLLLFMNMKSGDARSRGWGRLARVDYIGNVIFIPSLIALMFGLVTGGIEFPWSSWRIILPIVLGVLGWIAFHVWEHFTTYPSVPSRLFSNRTSATAYALTFSASVLATTLGYFLPVYFQAVLRTTVFYSGVYYLPSAIGILVSAVIGGVLLSAFGAYRPFHALAFAFGTIGFGLFTILRGNSHAVMWVFFQLIVSVGVGIPVSTCLPAIMVALPESDVASATAAFSFIKIFGYVWGVTIPSILFNAVVNNNLFLISSPSLRDQLRNGGAYSFASQANSLAGLVDGTVWDEVEQVYVRSLNAIWWFGLGISAVSFLAVGLERGLELSTELNTEFGLDDDKTEVSRTGINEKGGRDLSDIERISKAAVLL